MVDPKARCRVVSPPRKGLLTNGIWSRQKELAMLAPVHGALAGVLHQCPQFPAGKVSRTARATRAGLWGWRRRPVMSQSIAWGYSGGQSEGQRHVADTDLPRGLELEMT